MCQAMGFKHLPMAGGIFDQHPLLMDRFMHIFSEIRKEEERKEAEKNRRQGGPTPKNPKMSSRPTY